MIDDPLIIVKNGLIEDIQKGSRSIMAPHAQDLGDIALLPAAVNAHVHLQLSWLSGKTLWHRGFSAWLESMVPQILAMRRDESAHAAMFAAIKEACAHMAQCGLGYFGDVGGGIAGAVSCVEYAANKAGLEARHFCEWFGFDPPGQGPWPENCAKEMEKNGLSLKAAPAGHALYSTSPRIMREAKDYCAAHGGIFTFHLAESEEEERALADGSGGIADYYREKVLPPHWRPPGLRPFAYAMRLGLLGPKTLAVHGVKLLTGEIKSLAESGAALCLCPRSNNNLNVGEAPVEKLIEAGALLCLGTDGLSSNTDLNPALDALWLREKKDIPWPALWRMLTINGAAALGLAPDSAMLKKGAKAAFSLWRIDHGDYAPA